MYIFVSGIHIITQKNIFITNNNFFFFKYINFNRQLIHYCMKQNISLNSKRKRALFMQYEPFDEYCIHTYAT